jgi:thiosulfate/3-mercaptopyruvate sulfurtransferase
MTATRPDPLVRPDWLAEHLDDPTVHVIQLLFEPDIDDYADGHVPRATSRFWKSLLWDDRRRDFATPAQAAERLGALGIGPDDTVVLYSGRNHYAMYGYWVLREMAGHRDVRVLDGGLARWRNEGYPVTTVVPTPTPVAYPAPARERDDVLAGLDRPGRVLIDARSPEEYAGERVKPAPGFDHGAESYGRIPGARHLHARDLMDPADGTILEPAELERLLRSVGAAPDQADEVVVYCRLSHRASSLWFVSTQLLGWTHVRVYDGSWTEWGSMVGMPVER